MSITYNLLSDFERIQVDMAAQGCISGTLAEWPALLQVLIKLGKPAKAETRAWVARDWCREIKSSAL